MEELQIIQNKIYEIRGQKVMLDRDLAELYGVTTSRLNEAVKRNIERFEGDDFMFQLTEEERENMSSQFATTSQSRRPKVALPYAFTEQGVAMLSGVLHSKIAIQVNRAVMRAFVTLRSQVASNSGVAAELAELKLQQEVLMRLLCDQNAKFEQQLNKVKSEFSSELAAMDRQYFSLLDRQLFVESQHPGVDRFGPPLYLAMGTWIEEYSPKSLVIFTVTKDDRFLLKEIGARFNPWLNWQGQKRAGWVFPKSRAKKLESVLPAGYDLGILKRACGVGTQDEKNER